MESKILHLDELYKPTKANIQQMGKVLANAFQDYPLFKCVIPDSNKRQKKLHYALTMITRFGFKYGEVYATSSNYEGVILYLTPNSGEMTNWRWFRCGFFKVLIKLGWKFLNDWNSIGEVVDQYRKKNAPFPHMYLMTIGVEPQFQGKGYGSMLIKSGLKRCDELNLPCYLETFKEKNVLIYKHLGFDLLDDYKIPETDLTIYSLLRRPL